MKHTLLAEPSISGSTTSIYLMPKPSIPTEAKGVKASLDDNIPSRHSWQKKGKFMRPSELLHIHREEVLEIMKRYPKLTNLRIVGSVARGEDTEESDIDFLIDTEPGATLFDVGGFQDELQELFGIRVDVIMDGDHLHKYMKILIDKEARAV